MSAYALYQEALCFARDPRVTFAVRCRARGVARMWRRILLAQRARAAAQYAA